MSVVQPGGGRRTPGGKPAQGQRSGQGPGQGRRPATTPGSGQGRGGRGAGPRQGTTISAGEPRRFSASTLAYAAIVVVVLAVIAVVAIKVTTGSNSSTSGSAPSTTPVSAGLLAEITGVPQSVADTVGVPSSVVAPSVYKGQPPLTDNGKPEAIFIGAEFCPLCGAERWAVVMALSKFGTWSGLEETTSSPWDTPPAVATFTFLHATYTSDVLSLTTVEHETNDTNGLGTRKALQPLTATEQHLWAQYAAHFGVQQGYPFMDIGNKVFVLGPSYNPNVLEGLDNAAIAAKLSNPNDPVTQSIVGTANYLTAAVCSITGQQPSSVCTAKATQEAATALGAG
jgi:hypothetical protein